MAEHRVPMLGDAWRRREDPSRSADPRLRRLVAALSTLEIAPPPGVEFRSELRAQLVAVTPRLVAEGVSTPDDAAEKSRSAEAAHAKPGFAVLRRPLVATACLLTALVLLLGGAVWLSRSALPGDVLYGLKRASENTEYALAGSTTDKGKLKLEFAATRIHEVGDLVPGARALALGPGLLADGALSDHAATLVEQTLGSADDDIRAAAQLLGAAAVSSGSSDPLSAITSWAPAQAHAMHVIAARLPKGAALRDARTTWKLIRAARARAAELKADLGCGCLAGTRTDSLGPLPCTRPCAHPAAPNGRGGQGPSSGPSSTGGSGTTGPSGATNGPATSHGHSYPGTVHRGAPGGAPPAGPGAPTHRGSAAPPVNRGPGQGAPPHRSTPPGGRATRPGHTGDSPTPTPTPRSSGPTTKVPGPSTVPVPSGTAGSCGITLGIGPIGIGIGPCG
jgi:Domain of unknown function (DUF5667)